VSRDRAARFAPAPIGAVSCGESAAVDSAGAEGRLKDPQPRTSGLLNAVEAASYVGMTLAGFYAWRVRHRIPNAIPGRALRFRPADLLVAHLNDFPQQSTTPARDTVLDFAELGRQHARRGFGGA